MTDQAEPAKPDAEPGTRDAETEAPEPDTIQTRGHSLKYGKQPDVDGASGRRARLRSPSRGAVRR